LAKKKTYQLLCSKCNEYSKAILNPRWGGCSLSGVWRPQP